MNVVRKDATITNTGTDEDFPGTFEVILSTPAEDRDGDELKTEDWEQPLPDHITFDIDHGMSVESTVGSGAPTINDDGNLVVAGTYSSLQKAQDTRTLVKEGHIRTTSVAFMTKTVTKGGKQVKVRELLNGAFVAVPSNREALVTASKSATRGFIEGIKAGARHSKADAEHVQAIHDHALALGAQSPSDDTGAAEGATGGKSVKTIQRMVAVKTVDGSYEQRQQAISDALDGAYPDPPDNGYIYAYPLATFDDSVVYRVSGDTDDRGQWQADYTVNDDGTITLGTPARVNMVEQVVPAPVGKTFTLKSQDDDAEESAAADESGTAAGEPVAVKDESAAAESDDVDLQLRAFALKAAAQLAE